MAQVMRLNVRELKVPWRDRFISLGDWADDAVGAYDYTTENGRFRIDFELRRQAGAIAVVVHQLNGRLPSPYLPQTQQLGHELHLVPRREQQPRIVPAAILMLIVWAELLAREAAQ